MLNLLHQCKKNLNVIEEEDNGSIEKDLEEVEEPIKHAWTQVEENITEAVVEVKEE